MIKKRILIITSTIVAASIFLFYGRITFANNIPLPISDSIYQPEIEQLGISSALPLYGELVTETFKFTSPEPIADSRYGRAVAVYEDTLVVSQEGGNNPIPGHLFIYERHANGPNNWGITNIITPSDGVDGHGLGASLSFDGETLLAGSATAVGNVAETGAAYIFERNAGGQNNWGEVAKLIAPDGAYQDRFGWSVSFDEDTAVVGARWHDGTGINYGSAYIYDRNEGGSNNWGFVKEITDSNPANNDRFGYSVAVTGDIIVVGADGEDLNGNESGIVYVFERNAGGSNNWGEIAQITPDVPLANERFGVAVKMDGDRLAVGAIELSTTRPGNTYIFERDAGGLNNWGQIAKLTPSDGTAGNGFGISLSLQDDTLVVGAHKATGVENNSGAAYVYKQNPDNPNQWDEITKLISSDGSSGDEFSRDVSHFDDTIVAGSFYDDDLCPQDLNCNSGAAYIYTKFLVADVFVNKSVSNEIVLPGQPITYTLNFGNNGPDVAFNTTITDVFPVEVQNLTIVNSGVAITPTGTIPFAWQVGDMAVGEGGTITITGIISPDLTTETTIVNTVEITSVLDVTATNNVDTAVTQIIIPEISFSPSDYTVNESAGSITVTAVLSPAQPFMDVFVDYETMAGTAVADQDYAPVSGTLTFPQGITETTMAIPILDNEISEPDRTFSLVLNNPVHAVLNNSTTAITILDDDIPTNINASDGEANDHFGFGIAASVNTAIVGAYLDDDLGTDAGSAYIYVQDGTGWVEQGKLLASDGSAGSFFGYSVSVSGDFAVVGAYGESALGAEAGAAYVFVRDGCSWVQEAKLTADDGEIGDRFGVSVAINGETIIVGAYRDDDNGTDSGSAYIFVRDGGNWVQEAKIKAADGSSIDTFGRTVSISGDTVVIGSFYDDDQGYNSGSAYVYQRTGTAWTQQAKLLAVDGVAFDQFGINVSIDGDSLIVGADGVDDTADYAGSAYVFVREGDIWNQQAKLLVDDGGAGDRFGSVSLQGDIAVVGALFNDTLGADSGAAYVFERSGTSWSLQSKLTASDGEAGDLLGRSVAIAQNAILASADGDDINGIDSGSVYSFHYPISTQNATTAQLCYTDVFVEKSVSNTTALPGQPITYTVDFGNNGPDIAFNTMITDVVPVAVQNLAMVNSGVAITPTGTIPYAWQVGDMAVGEGGTITITGIISPDLAIETTIVNTVEITSSLDVTTTNNVDTAVMQVIIPEISFSPSNYTVNESAGSITVTAVLSPVQPFLDVFVDYETMDGTAVADQDYAPVSGTLTFPQGITETTMAIPILDNAIPEPDRTFSLALNNPVHAILNNSSATITILDDDIPPTESVVFLPIILNMPAEPEPDFPLFIGEAIASRPVTVSGEVFFSTTLNIPPTLSETGLFFLSSDQDQLTEIVVDDEFAILLDGEEVFVYTFSSVGHPPQSMIVEIPRSVMEPLAGQAITVVYRDVFSHAVSASAIWLQYIP